MEQTGGKAHNAVSGMAEIAERQQEAEVSQQTIQQRIQDREKVVTVLQQEVKAINLSADKAVEDSERIFNELIELLERSRFDVNQKIRSQQETEKRRVKELQAKLEQEIAELKRKDAELKHMPHTEDHSQFLQNYFGGVTAAVSETRDQLQEILREKWTNISWTVTQVDVLLPQPEPETRAEFLKYSREITLDQNTANKWLLLSEGNRKVTVAKEEQSYSRHADRFIDDCQVLSRKSLAGRYYWEVELTGGGVDVAVAYKSNSRAGGESAFGWNDKSWALHCDQQSYTFWENKSPTFVPCPPSTRVGVYLDHRAGILSFYSVSETMTLLHRVQTTFTDPLYAGLGLYCPPGDTAEFILL